jgi:hypothetical protein
MNESAAFLACPTHAIAGSAHRETAVLRAACETSAGTELSARLRTLGTFEPRALANTGRETQNARGLPRAFA